MTKCSQANIYVLRYTHDFAINRIPNITSIPVNPSVLIDLSGPRMAEVHLV